MHGIPIAPLAMKPTASPSEPVARRGRALLALALLLPVPSLGTAASLMWWPESPVARAVFVAGKIWITVLPFLWLKWVERGRLSCSPPRQGGFLVGAALGTAIAALVFGAYFVASKAGLIDAAMVAERARRTGLNDLTLYVAGAIYWITLNSLMEEYVWRWFTFRQFEALVGGRWAVLGAALGFTAHHVIALAAQFGPAVTVLGSLGVLVGGATWSWLYLRYRSVWPCYVSHALVDLPIFVIGYWLIFGRNN